MTTYVLEHVSGPAVSSAVTVGALGESVHNTDGIPGGQITAISNSVDRKSVV